MNKINLVKPKKTLRQRASEFSRELSSGLSEFLQIALGILLFVGFLAVMVYLPYVSYFERFPNASWWSFFFR